jgi:MFS transporter, DHA3 family, macrolide efflux protein
MKTNKSFIYLILGQSMANIGDVLYTITVISFLYKQTDSAALTSMVPFTITMFMFISSLLTPILVGRFNLKYLLLWPQLGKTAIMFGLSSYFMTGTNLNSFYLIFIFIAAIAFLDGCANPVKLAMIPQYVEASDLVRANGISETVNQFVQVFMWFIGGIILSISSVEFILWSVTLIFVFASLVISFLKPVEYMPVKEEKKRVQITSGWKTIAETPALLRIAIIDFLESFAEAVWVSAIILVFVTEALNQNEAWWGFINGAFFTGLILGSVFSVKYAFYIEKNLREFFYFSAMASFILTSLFSFTTIPVMALMLSLFLGISGQLEGIPKQTIIQKSVLKEQLAAVYTSLSSIATGTFGIAAVTMGLIAELIGIRAVFMTASLLLLIVSVIAFRGRKLFGRETMRIEN